MIKFNYFFLLLSLLIFGISSYAQENIEVNYNVTYKVLFNDTKDSKAEKRENHFKLFLNSKTSFFKNVNVFVKDSLLESGEIKYTGNIDKDLALEMKYDTDLEYTVFNDRGKVTFANKFGSTKVKYFEIVKFDWKITLEQKTIYGFKCIKATTTKWGRNWTAYFSTAHLIPSGPYKFHGLPGLIFEVFDDNEDYHFSLVKFKNRKKATVEMHNFPKAKVVTKQQYEKIRLEKALQVPKFSVQGIPDIEKKLLKTKMEIEKNYNPIELTE